MFQGTAFNARSRFTISRHRSFAQRPPRDVLKRLNERHLKIPPATSSFRRIASYELAAKMQLSVPEVSDLPRNPPPRSSCMARMIRTRSAAVSRRTASCPPVAGTERPFATLNGAYAGRRRRQLGRPPQARSNTTFTPPSSTNPPPRCSLTSSSAAARRHARRLDHRVRMPTFERRERRDHNPSGFTVWLAGAGVKHGCSYGATDELVTKPWITRPRSTICTPPSSICSVWTTNGSVFITTESSAASLMCGEVLTEILT